MNIKSMHTVGVELSIKLLIRPDTDGDGCVMKMYLLVVFWYGSEWIDSNIGKLIGLITLFINYW